MMDWNKQNLADQEEEQRRLNYERRKVNQMNINTHKNKVLQQNAEIRHQLKNASSDMNN